MATDGRTYRIFLSAAEPSADGHCAGLISALKETPYSFEFAGVGGPKMAEAGCELLEVTSGKAVMIYKAVKHMVRYYKLIMQIKRYLKNNDIDLVIVCDSPAFNFHVAKVAKKLGIKTLFYVAPQLWAWAPWRIRKLRKYCDKLACILPFEQEWFSQRSIDTIFVGNPMLDELPKNLVRFKKQYNDFQPADVKIALMPGSRMAEIESLWQPMQQVTRRLKKKYPNLSVTAVAVDEEKKEILRTRQLIGFNCRYIIGSVTEAAREADFALVASGSATLQVAAAGCPMVILYQSSKVLWHALGRWLVNTEHLSLVNILAGDELVPEFMPHFLSVEPVIDAVERLLEDKDQLTQTSAALIKLAGSLRKGNAAKNVAQIVTEMLD